MEGYTVKLVDITKETWLEVLFLTTNQNGMPTLCEEQVASNALSIVDSIYEKGWIIKAIENEGQLIDFTMYGYCEKQHFYELCRDLIDRKYQNKGYGTQAIKLVLEEMKSFDDCHEVYLSTGVDNLAAKHVYEKNGFLPENRKNDNEDLYKMVS